MWFWAGWPALEVAMRRTLVWALAALLVLVPATSWAQTAQVGQVRGEVKDATGGALPGATVMLTSEERGFSRTEVTDSQGRYLFPVVPLGTYTLTVTLSSFEKKVIAGNRVEAEQTTVVPVTLALATLEVATTVTGETPIVDASNQTLQTRVRSDEFQKLPIGRSYQTLIGQAPGVVGTGNVNAHGALTSNNLFMFDGVNTTDPTTGTFGANMNFEAIQEVLIRTSSVSAEFGRATGAIVDVITKSGTNRFEGSYKFIATNDDWNAQNTTVSEVNGASLERVKFDKVNPVNSFTIGGPALRDRLWFFMAYEKSENTTPQRQTNAAPGFPNEDYQQTTESPFFNLRITSQVERNNNVWFKYAKAPTDGFVVDYWGASAEREALTLQNQGGDQVAGQWTSVIGSNLTASLTVAGAGSFIDVVPFEPGPLDGGAPYFDQNNNRYYNGSTFDGRVDRPRVQATGAVEYFTTLGANTHAIKVGFDWQGLESENFFRYPANRLFYVTNFNPITRSFDPDFYEEYDDAPSISKGNQVAFFVRDKFQLNRRTSVEAGLRFDRQTGESDIGATTVETFNIAPRISASYAITPDGKTLAVASYGRFHDSILQDFSDQFASVPQQGNYNTYVWNGSEYVFDSRVEAGGNNFRTNTDIGPRHMDEFTIGVERQLSNVLGVGVRYVDRNWSNFVDDVWGFDADGSVTRSVDNIDEADRTYRGIELSATKRFSNNWTAAGSYTYSRTRGNHFADVFTTWGDFPGATCRQTVDPGLGDGSGLFPCSDILANLDGRPSFDRPHLLKFNGAYTRNVGPVVLTGGFVGSATSKTTYSKTRTVSVLRPGTLTQVATRTYYYEPQGTDRVDGLLFIGDLSLEAAYRVYDRANVGFKFETFNLFNNEEKTNVNNQAWCNSTATAACQTAVTNHGKASARGSFAAPRTIRFTFLVRY
jgi:hypothetical protein